MADQRFDILILESKCWLRPGMFFLGVCAEAGTASGGRAVGFCFSWWGMAAILVCPTQDDREGTREILPVGQRHFFFFFLWESTELLLFMFEPAACSACMQKRC